MVLKNMMHNNYFNIIMEFKRLFGSKEKQMKTLLIAISMDF